MDDQANDLRRLVRQGLQANASSVRPPKLVLVTSGKGGVGTTTVAIGVAAAAAQRGARPVLVDGNPHGGDVAVLCRVPERWTLADLISSRCTLEEALQDGPDGMRVLPGVWGQDIHEQYSAAAQERLIEQIRGLGTAVDCVVIDAGCGSGRVLRRFWQAADVVVAVTTPEVTSVMDTYAAIKLLAPTEAPPAVMLLVNRASSKAVAEDVHHRLEHACRRFLGLRLQRAGSLGPQADAVIRRGVPLARTTGRSRREMAQVLDAILEAAVGPAGRGWRARMTA